MPVVRSRSSASSIAIGQWFLARTGTDASETPRDVAFCAHAILDDALFEVPDASRDARFADNPLVVDEPKIRFYAGAPISVEGHNVGTLCVIDREPRAMTLEQRGLLRDLGDAVGHWMHSRRQAQRMHEAESYKRHLFEHLGEAVLVTGEDFPIRDANASAAALFGRSAEELTTLSIGDLLNDQGRRWLADHPGAGPDVLGDASRLWRFVHRDERSFACAARPHRVDDRSFVVWIQDVEEIRAHDERLGRLVPAVQQSSESIVSTGLDSRIQYANPVMFVTSGYSASELIGSNASILGSGKTPRVTFEVVYPCLNAGERWHGHLLNRRKDGTEFTQETTVSPRVRMPDGAITQYVAVMTDVTERLRLENELRESREHLEEIVLQRTRELADAMHAAEAANAAKSVFLATMSHEIRTPMNGVIGMIECLQALADQRDQADTVRTIRVSAFSLLGIIDDILDFSKIEAGRLDLDTAPWICPGLIESVCDTLLPMAARKRVTCGCSSTPRCRCASCATRRGCARC